jgi:hypothetical protein
VPCAPVPLGAARVRWGAAVHWRIGSTTMMPSWPSLGPICKKPGSAQARALSLASHRVVGPSTGEKPGAKNLRAPPRLHSARLRAGARAAHHRSPIRHASRPPRQAPRWLPPCRPIGAQTCPSSSRGVTPCQVAADAEAGARGAESRGATTAPLPHAPLSPPEPPPRSLPHSPMRPATPTQASTACRPRTASTGAMGKPRWHRRAGTCTLRAGCMNSSSPLGC